MSWLRRLLPYTSVILVLAVGYAGWTLLSRKRADRLAAETASAVAAFLREGRDGMSSVVDTKSTPTDVVT